MNTISLDDNTKNFIHSKTESVTQYKLNNKFISRLEERRKNQYIEGDIIVVHVQRQLSDKSVDINKDKETSKSLYDVRYFVVLSSHISTQVIICPVFLISIYKSLSLGKHQIALGVINNICSYKLAYADLSLVMNLNKNKMKLFLSNQSNLVFNIGKDLTKSLLNKCKNVLFDDSNT